MNDSLRSRLHDALITARSAAAPLLGETLSVPPVMVPLLFTAKSV